MKLADLFVDIHARGLSAVRTQMEGLRKSTAATASRMKQLGSHVQRAGRSMMKIGAVSTAAWGASAALLGKFEQQMAFVSTMVDDTRKHMGRFSKGVKELSIRFGESTETISRG